MARDFKEFIWPCDMAHVCAGPHCSQSNDKIKRWRLLLCPRQIRGSETFENGVLRKPLGTNAIHQPAERGRRAQRSCLVDPALRDQLQRIVAKAVVVVEVFVSHCSGEDALCHKRPQVVGDPGRITRIADAIGDCADEADASVNFSQECGSGV